MLFLEKSEKKPDPMVSVTCKSFIIASIAAFLGFSLALGAFFAGLAFSRDPEANKMKRPFETLYDFFSPFFFILLGFKFTMISTFDSVPVILLLLLAAIFGKLLGTYFPSYLMNISKKGSLALGISMIARAEIAMIIIERGFTLKDSLLTSSLFSDILLVILSTSVITSLILPFFFRNFINPKSKNLKIYK